MELVIVGVICFFLTMALTPYVKKLAFKIGATDQPNKRKVHQRIMPRLGGLAIFISFMTAFLIINPNSAYFWPILIGAVIVTAMGMVDDVYELAARYKFLVQTVAALIVVLNGVEITYINLPFANTLHFGYWSIPITVIWIVGITNAINLIDGLDGLAAGVSTIALITIAGLALSLGDVFVALVSILLIGSTMGFLVFNFHPAKIFMGDTGALFLGYMIGVLSVLGFKNATLFSLLVPIAILGVPILDTLFAIVRRVVHKKPLYSPDKMHLHHCLLNLGFGHRQTVILIYAMSAMFSIAGVILNQSTMWGSTITFFTLTILIELVVEITGIISVDYRPLLNLFNKRK
ncbi:UDP-GlcNAc:undecaprenyl-phosphate GlcNAc-1-phosphate transferase [Amphibacillus marinus]|uniref:UDP-GlcNAc:undecaprenyl-phosphate GlcNAc-1-phosphate transferase n=1 Tax=Amphibacillus marinus TaxID=872970 RepID=A0A1H8N429_9BACI|nr:MraY family glycosyltransferase [Amphibacillus marinus]SEO24344.1 UDP-GlcNAc:undecaprenyl-phosphate GlcNAc-1-phosphate transferase [Amphibacillus marinus]